MANNRKMVTEMGDYSRRDMLKMTAAGGAIAAGASGLLRAEAEPARAVKPGKSP